jgi:hypothetical protein
LHAEDSRLADLSWTRNPPPKARTDLRIGVTNPHYDDIGAILGAMGISYLSFNGFKSEEYDLVFRRDFYQSETGQALLAAMRSANFREAVTRLGGYDVERSGTVKLEPSPAKSTKAARSRAGRVRRVAMTRKRAAGARRR